MIRRSLLLALLASCAAPQSASTAFQGPVAVGKDGRSFVDGAGNPCFWLGDTQWELFTTFKEDEARAILEDRRAKGFNAVQVMIVGVKGVKRANVHGEQPLASEEPLTPNENYFKRIDGILRIAEELHLTLVIGLYHKSTDWSKVITVAHARSWAAWVGRRYASAPNIIWSMYPEAKD